MANGFPFFNNTTLDLNSVFFIDSNTGWVVSDNGYAYKTTNGGATWTNINTLANGFPFFNNTTLALNSIFFIKEITTQVSEEKLDNTSLYPNPATTYFNLNNLAEGTSVNVMDVTGNVVISNSVIDADKTMTIETSNLSNGIYIIQLKNNGAVAHKKLIVSK
ncbi:MAG: T9SS type A sorting domain-containing protein [Bacteroidia bacterium]|nr:T9SS type A sorting domain-containing protein [Bacteroidia bacterium]